MVLEINKIFGNLGALQAGSIGAKQPIPQTSFKSNNPFQVKGSPDPFNAGELSPVTDCKFDSNKWITNFAQ